ncbi:TIGR00730 family Rossman fold protein [Lentzea sp. DG1S-22]|uniref:LOG family protein n=1 Tax=Lentzea sp. DG1S-22 TaxID=3108822 RepID=UPI002E79A79D|nr:TIGR00730 family Rossman fold protein [Lentzea sp. DG1S-22]WVH82360.1 TIGR00730 family Rossman fold protein [Lentzea sp. DG1S-22]
MNSRVVAVFCSASEAVPRRCVDLARAVGAGAAARGWTVLTGGQRTSMMAAVTRGAQLTGGRAVGVIPEVLADQTDRLCDELHMTKTIAERKSRMIELADSLLVLPGGLGTCEELFDSWTARIIGQHDKPMVLLDPDGHYAGLLGFLGEAERTGFVAAKHLSLLTTTTEVDQALTACLPAPVTS